VILDDKTSTSMPLPERLSATVTFKPVTLEIRKVPFWPYLVLQWPHLWRQKLVSSSLSPTASWL